MTDVVNPDELNDDELVEIVLKAGTYTAAASHFGWLRDKFTRYLSSRSLKIRTDKELEQQRKEATKTEKQLEKEVAEAEKEDLAQRIKEREVNRVDQLEHQVKELERALRKERDNDIIAERILDRFSDAIDKVEPKYNPDVIPSIDRELDEHEFVLLFSDTHAGEVVSSEETLGLNEYNWDIMLERMGKIQESVLSYQAHRPYSVSKLHVFNLGDSLSGDIHDELLATNDRPMAEATVQFGYDQAEFLAGFAPYFESIEFVGVPGNHPRATKKPSNKEAHNNADWIANKITELALQYEPKFDFYLPKSAFATHIVADRWRCLLMHGDGIRSTMPGVPWGGVARRVTTLEQQFAKAKQPIDYVTLGHFHTANVLDGVGSKTFVNGSVKGPDEYSLKQFGSGRQAIQLLLTFHPRNGLTDVSYIDLQPVSPAGE